MPFKKGHKINVGRKASYQTIAKLRMMKSHLGKKHSDEAKKKMSLVKIGKRSPALGKHWTLSEETKKRMAGRVFSKETREKMRVARLGKTNCRKGKKGKGWTLEARKRFSELQKGENGNNWKGGLSSTNEKARRGIEFRLWREAVYARDNWTCQKYKTNGGMLHTHHIQNFSQHPELRFAIDNGITLSKKAHNEFHKLYGFRNNTKEQIYNYINL